MSCVYTPCNTLKIVSYRSIIISLPGLQLGKQHIINLASILLVVPTVLKKASVKVVYKVRYESGHGLGASPSLDHTSTRMPVILFKNVVCMCMTHNLVIIIMASQNGVYN